MTKIDTSEAVERLLTALSHRTDPVSSEACSLIITLVAEADGATTRWVKAEAEVARLREGLERLANSVHAFSPAWVQRTARDCLTPSDDPAAPGSRRNTESTT